MTAQPKTAFRFDRYELDVANRRLFKDGEEVAVQPKVLDVLAQLVERSGQLVLKTELLDAVWPNTVVTENSLTRCILELRRLLNDSAEAPRFIQTVPRRGYTFVANVRSVPTEPLTARPPRSLLARAVVAGAALALVSGGWLLWASFQNPEPDRASIAVLPFDNLSDDAQAARYFSDGVSEEILNKLSQMPDLRVAARSSSFAFRDRKDDLAEIARELEVAHVLDGSVRMADNRVRVTAQLIEPGTGTSVWSESFERELTDIFALQDEIAATVLSRMRLSLGPLIVRHPTSDIQAYRHYLLGRDYLNRRPPGWWAPAAQSLRAAIERDPEFAEAHALLGIAYLLTADWETPRPESFRLGKAAIDRALAIDSDVADAQAALGLYYELTADYRRAETALRAALALNPIHVQARHWLANTLGELGQLEECVHELETALAIDPLNPIVLANIAKSRMSAGQHEQARALLDKGQLLPEPSYPTKKILAWLERDRGNLALAMDIRFHMLDSFPKGYSGEIAAEIGSGYAELGLFELAEQWAKFAGRNGAGLESRTLFPRISLLRGDVEQARARVTRLAADWRPVAPNDSAFKEQIRLGVLFGRLQSHDDVIALLEPATIDGGALPFHRLKELELDVAHMLLLAYRQNDRERESQQLLQQTLAAIQPRKDAGQWAQGESLYAEAATHAIAGEIELSIELLSEAIEAGWRGYYDARTDPRWARVAEEPTFQNLMNQVQSHLATEREALVLREPPQRAAEGKTLEGRG